MYLQDIIAFVACWLQVSLDFCMFNNELLKDEYK